VFHLVSERRKAKFQNKNEREASFVSVADPPTPSVAELRV